MFKEKLTGIESESAENSGSSIEREKELRAAAGEHSLQGREEKALVVLLAAQKERERK